MGAKRDYFNTPLPRRQQKLHPGFALILLEYSQIRSSKGEPMPKKVTAKQHNSKMCFVCGLKNPSGLKPPFTKWKITNWSPYSLLARNIRDIRRLHGGLAATILDETIGRAMNINNERSGESQLIFKPGIKNPSLWMLNCGWWVASPMKTDGSLKAPVRSCYQTGSGGGRPW